MEVDQSATDLEQCALSIVQKLRAKDLKGPLDFNKCAEFTPVILNDDHSFFYPDNRVAPRNWIICDLHVRLDASAYTEIVIAQIENMDDLGRHWADTLPNHVVFPMAIPVSTLITRQIKL